MSARAATAVATTVREARAAHRAPALADDELRFDFDDAPPPPPAKPQAAWPAEPGGVKAAILRWLEEQA